jgi:hypothetical protein
VDRLLPSARHFEWAGARSSFVAIIAVVRLLTTFCTQQSTRRLALSAAWLGRHSVGATLIGRRRLGVLVCGCDGWLRCSAPAVISWPLVLWFGGFVKHETITKKRQVENKVETNKEHFY